MTIKKKPLKKKAKTNPIVKTEVVKVKDSTSKCHHCDRKTDEDDYCYGCKDFICGVCDIEMASGYGHHPDDHLG